MLLTIQDLRISQCMRGVMQKPSADGPAYVLPAPWLFDNVTYKYFDTGAANAGLNLNLIFSDNGSKQLNDYNVTLNQDYYLEATPTGVVEFDPSAVVTHDGYAVLRLQPDWLGRLDAL